MTTYREVRLELTFVQTIKVRVDGADSLTDRQRGELEEVVARDINDSGDPGPSKVTSDPWSGGHWKCYGLDVLWSSALDAPGEEYDLRYSIDAGGDFEFEDMS